MERQARRLGRCGAAVALGALVLMLGSAAPVLAQTDDENARIHFESGASYLKQSDNENALREFQAAYALSKRPALLLNIANVYERMGKPKEAVDTLTKYLEEDPKTTDRVTVETRISNLKKRVESTPPPPAAGATRAERPARHERRRADRPHGSAVRASPRHRGAEPGARVRRPRRRGCRRRRRPHHRSRRERQVQRCRKKVQTELPGQHGQPHQI